MQGIDEKLVFEFVYTFSRFEYALKRAGYHGQDGGDAKPQWDEFENDLTAIPTAELAPVLSSGDYILTAPPKKQVVKNSGLGWEDSPPEGASRIKTLLIYVRRIRNNLFHGGKFPEGPVQDAARDRDLIHAGISVLQALLKVPSLPGGIQHYFAEEG